MSSGGQILAAAFGEGDRAELAADKESKPPVVEAHILDAVAGNMTPLPAVRRTKTRACRTKDMELAERSHHIHSEVVEERIRPVAHCQCSSFQRHSHCSRRHLECWDTCSSVVVARHSDLNCRPSPCALPAYDRSI